MNTTTRGVVAVVLLCGSNAFMNVAWYLHLKFKSWPMVKAIFISWLIAFAEYCLQVPANRIGHFSSGGPFTAPQLKTLQEFLTLTTFAIFSITVLKEKLRWPDMVAFGLIFSGVLVGMLLKPKTAASDTEVALPPPPVAPAPEPAASTSAAPGAPAPEQHAGKTAGGLEGRKLLQLLPGAWRHGSGGWGSSDGVQLSQQAQQARPDYDSEQQQESESQERGHGQGQRQEPARRPGSSSSSQQEELLPAAGRQALQSESSTAVLLASGADVHLSSSRQGTHQREHVQSSEGEGEGDPRGTNAPADRLAA